MMMRPRPPLTCACRRRDLERTSSTPVSDESSTKSGASARRWQASRILGQRCSATLPRRRSSPLIRAWEATKRWASSDSDISRENSATACPASTAFSAMLATSADLPIEGRAARMTRLPAWKPPVFSSRSLKPDGVPVRAVLDTDRRWSLSVSSCRMSAIERIFFWRSSVATSRTERSACSTSSRAGASRERTLAWIS